VFINSFLPSPAQIYIFLDDYFFRLKGNIYYKDIVIDSTCVYIGRLERLGNQPNAYYKGGDLNAQNPT